MALQLSQNEQLFVQTVAKMTGLNPDVVAAWVRNEEPAANQTVGQNDQNYLNIGNVDSGGRSHTSAWSNPVSAGQATANWMKGKQGAVPGYGTASGGIQSILKAGKDPSAEIRAIQGSGWASGGETALPSLYSQASGQPFQVVPGSGAMKAPTSSVPKGPAGTTGLTGSVTAAGTTPAAAPSGPKGSDLLSLFGTQDAQSNPAQSNTWASLASLLKSKGQ